MTKIAAKIDPDGTLTKLTYTTGTEYETLKDAVGGWLESPSILTNSLSHCAMWVNEEGKFDPECKENPVATLIVGYWGSDIIMGPLVITGGPDGEGDTKSLIDDEYELIEGYVEQARARLAKFLVGYQS